MFNYIIIIDRRDRQIDDGPWNNTGFENDTTPQVSILQNSHLLLTKTTPQVSIRQLSQLLLSLHCFFLNPFTLSHHNSVRSILILKNKKKPTRCHLLFYCTSYKLNMFRAILCPSSGARDYDVDYHIGRFVLGLL